MNPSSRSFPKTLTDAQLIAVERLRARFAQLPDERMPGRIIHRIDEEKNRDRNYLQQHDRVKRWSNEKSTNRRGSWGGGELSSSDVAGDRRTFHL
jgi:hypothetical protein